MKFRFVLSLVCCLFLAVMLAEQSCAMLALSNRPGRPGTKYFLMYPYYHHADTYKGSSRTTTIENIDLNIYINSIRMAINITGLNGKSLYYGFIQPVGRIEILGDVDTGIGDIELIGGQWLIEDHESKTYLGLACGIFFPIGSYDKSKAANLGLNIYRFRPIIQFAKQFGNLDFEWSLKYQYNTENPDTRVQAGYNIFFESYLGYFLKPNVLCGVHFDADFEEDSRISGTKINDSASEKYKAGPSATWIVNEGLGLDVLALFEFNAKNTTEGFSLIFRFAKKF